MPGEGRDDQAPQARGGFAPRLRLPAGTRPNVYYPTLADPRFISVVLLLGLDLYALATPSFGRHASQWAAAVFSWVAVDSLLLVFYQRLLLVPLSALVPALATFVLVDSPHVWPYAAVGAAGVLSKHFIRIDGRHIFNPLNLGLVVGLLFFGDSVAFGTSRFGDSPWLFLWVGALGILVAGRCRRLDIALAYTATFLLGALARGLLSSGQLVTAASSATNIVFYMYAFHMMTDPKTTPDSRSHRVVFGVLVGLLDAALRSFGVVNAPLYALFCISGALPYFRVSEGRVPDSFIWKLRALRLTGLPVERLLAPREAPCMRSGSRAAGLAVAAAVLSLGFWTRARLGPGPGVPAPPSGGLSFSLTEAASASGLDYTPGRFAPHPMLANIAPRLGSLGVSVAVVDYDGDGWPDVFVSNPARGGRNRLFRNNRDGAFTDVAAAAGLAHAAGQAGAMRALFFDSQNDGHEDLLLTTSSCTVFFKNMGGGRFADETRRSGLRHCGVSYATNAIDYDGDGYLDVVIADYFKPVDFARPSSFDFMPDSAVSAGNGGPILVYRNDHDGTFTRVAGDLGIKSRGWTLAVGVYDLRGVGRPDLYFATDFNSDQVYFNEGGGRFKNASGLVVDKYSRSGMSAEIADVDNDGRAAVYVSNIHEPPYILGRNMLWKWLPPGRFADVAGVVDAAECGWSWGAKFLDLDNDGLQDLVVTNGYISASRERDYWYQSGLMGSAAGRVVQDARNWPPMRDSSLAGYEKKCVYRNTGSRFEDVTDRTGWALDRSDGRGLAAIDHLNDGRLSLIEANEGQPLRFYRNEQMGKNRWIGFKLTGTRSNRDAFGARVSVRLEGKTLTREVQPANGFMAQSDGRLHFGLGPSPRIKEALIRWPSGTVQRLSGLGMDRYHAIKEPQGRGGGATGGFGRPI